MSKTVLITGASDGIGAAAARHAVGLGHEVVIVGRNAAKTEAIGDELGIDRYVADFAELAQVRTLGENLRQAYPRIDVLANNAGGIIGRREITIDGFEKTFQVNHLAGFLLTNILLPNLVQSSASVIQTASVGNWVGHVDIDKLQTNDRYVPLRVYGTTKLQNIMFTAELDRRYRHQGISAASFHPGNVNSSFGVDTGSRLISVVYKAFRRFLITPEKGADTLNWLVDSQPRSDWEPGEYYVNRKQARANPQASNAELADRLWDRSAVLVGLDS